MAAPRRLIEARSRPPDRAPPPHRFPREIVNFVNFGARRRAHWSALGGFRRCKRRQEKAMAGSWSRDGAVLDQTEDTVMGAVRATRCGAPLNPLSRLNKFVMIRPARHVGKGEEMWG
jgi:hypothetical protein